MIQKKLKLILVDVDGVLVNMPKLWALIYGVFKARYETKDPDSLKKVYYSNRAKSPWNVVSNTIEAGAKKFGSDFWHVFYDVDFKACLYQSSWEILKKEASEKNISLHIFSEGDIVSPPSAPATLTGYQIHKITQLALGLPAENIHIYSDKMSKLSELIKTLSIDQSEIGLIDDRQEIRDRAMSLYPSIMCFNNLADATRYVDLM